MKRTLFCFLVWISNRLIDLNDRVLAKAENLMDVVPEDRIDETLGIPERIIVPEREDFTDEDIIIRLHPDRLKFIWAVLNSVRNMPIDDGMKLVGSYGLDKVREEEALIKKELIKFEIIEDDTKEEW